MRPSRHPLKPLILLVLVLAFLLSACNAEEPAVEPAAVELSPTPQPQIIQIGLAEDAAVAAAEAMPTPTATPEPTVTPVPFSYYAPTVNMTYEELVGSTDDVNAKAQDLLKDGYPDPKTYYIIVDKQWQVVLVYKRIDDGSKFGKPDYEQPVRYMICSTGNPDKEHGNETTSGTWPIEIPKERFWQFVNLEAAQYLTLIHSRTYFHSILYKKKGDLNSLVQESYDRLGQKDSHACIRLTVPDARWMFYNIGYGTTCEIRDGDKEDQDVAAIKAQLILPSSKKVSLKASDLWTDNWTIAEVAHELAYKYKKPPIPDMGDDDDTEATVTDGGTTGTDPVVTPDAGAGTANPDPGTGGATTGGDAGGTTTGDGDTGSTGGPVIIVP